MFCKATLSPPLRTALGRLLRNLRGLKTLLLSLSSWHRLWRKGASVRGQRNIRTPVSLQLLRRMCASAADISRLVNHMLKYFIGIFKKCHVLNTPDKLWSNIFFISQTWCVSKITV